MIAWSMIINYAAICGITFFLGSGESCRGTEKLTEIKDLKNCQIKGRPENFLF